MTAKSAANVSSVITPDYSAYGDPKNPNGFLTAFTYVEVTDIFGNTRIRKVCIGRAHNMQLDTARDLVSVAREKNADKNISALFTIGL